MRAWFHIFTVLPLALAAAENIRIVSSSGAPYNYDNAGDRYIAERMLDGDPATFCCLLDDSRTGKDAATRPPRGSLPVTGSVLFELKAEEHVVALEFISRKDPVAYGPKRIDVIDGAGKVIAANVTLPGRSNGYGSVLEIPDTLTRRIGFKVLESYAPVDDIHYNWQLGEFRIHVRRSHDRVVSIGGKDERTLSSRFTPRDRAYTELRLREDWRLQDKFTKFADAEEEAAYYASCARRRNARLAELRTRCRRIVYTKHYFMSGYTHYAWTDHLTDEQLIERGADYRMGSSLNQLTLNEDGSITNEVLLDCPTGIIRDPNLSYDATKVVFAMRHNDTTDDYHLYTLELATRKVKQITFGKCVSDTEPCFLPDGGIAFVSSRCVQLTDCWIQSVSNIYRCDAEGRYIRRLGFDQVHTNYPQVLDDGRIIYTRWEYNDRSQIWPQPLFVMNPDGTRQAEFYGNNSWFPTSILHARGIPGTGKAIGIASGHHVTQRGKLIVIDRSKGTQEADGIEYLAPRRKAEAVRIDQLNHAGEAFQYPFAFDERHYLVTYCPEGFPRANGTLSPHKFGVYYMTEDGARELLAFDPDIHCCQAVPVVARKVPHRHPESVDLRSQVGTCYVQNVHEGESVKGVKPGTIKSLRVVALEYRAAGAYYNSNIGEGGMSHSRTPISINNGSWDVKHVLGEVPVEGDGSVNFEVPARTPCYFQLLDARGRVVQTMRSWVTLMPGEAQACVGCHESKMSAPPAMPSGGLKIKRLADFGPYAASLAAKDPLDPALSPEEAVRAYLSVNSPDGLTRHDGFSFPRLVQPILDQHCVRCHTGGEGRPFSLKKDVAVFDFRKCPNNGDATQESRRAFSEAYVNLTSYGHGSTNVCWISAQSRPTPLPPYYAGSCKSALMDRLEPAHHGVKLSEGEKRTIACWIDLCVPFCGSYTEANTWSKRALETYLYFERKRAAYARVEVEHLRRWREHLETGREHAPESFPRPDFGNPVRRQCWTK